MTKCTHFDATVLSAADEDARGYATRLLEHFVAEHFPHNPDWKPLPDLVGVLTQLDNAITIARDYKSKLAALAATPALVRRPVAFRVQRANADGMTLSKTEWRYFTDEAEARIEADALLADYQGLYVRDGRTATPAVGGERCPHDMGFDNEIGPLGCRLVGMEMECVCEHMHFAAQPASPLREAEIWDNAFEYFKADTARAKLALKPAGWFIGDNEGGFHQAAEEFEGMDGTTPLYAAPSPLRANVCCYCDAPLSCARCGMEQPDDAASPLRGREAGPDGWCNCLPWPDKCPYCGGQPQSAAPPEQPAAPADAVRALSDKKTT